MTDAPKTLLPTLESAHAPVELGTFQPVEGSAERISAFVQDGAAMKAMATAIANSGAYRHKNPNTVMTIMLAAYEMNIGIATALKGMYPVSGKLELETWLMAGLAIMRSGVVWDDIEVSGARCALRLRREGWEPKEVEYTLEHASKMGLIHSYNAETGEFKTNKPTDPWRRSTEEMLYWRCLSKGLKRIAPDYFGGMYVSGELTAAVAVEQGTSSAASDMAALLAGVEPDEDEFTEDEISQYAREVREAKKAGVISAQKATAMIDAVERGKWSKCIEDLDAMRRAMLVHLAEASNEDGDDDTQGGLGI